MAERIQLLPDNIANQIAAGEVIQRPASAVKELLENAVDAGATEIRLILIDAGKNLIQVIDNGSGMSEIDARLCFERHATSKIKSIDDLFHIRTMGFRGEALASVAAVAQVELKTRRAEDEAGVYLEIENSQLIRQEPIASPQGTSIAMKNLFFNIPARRNFLKSNAAEMRHIVDEFTRVSMAFPNVLFTLTSNGQQLFHLEAGSLKQRIVQLLGNNYNAKLFTVKEDTDYMNVSGFAGKPETAKRTRGDQYFFVNNRFIKSAYLNHAVMSAYQDMIPGDSFPLYVLFIDLDPAQVDVNVHPTKQEIKFEDEKIVYAFIHSAVKHALAQFSITPAIDFDLDPSIQQLSSIQQPFTEQRKASATSGSIFQGFTRAHQAHLIDPTQKPVTSNWQDYYKPVQAVGQQSADPIAPKKLFVEADTELQQILNTYITVPSDNGFYLVHQQAAHERIRYNQLKLATEGKEIPTQQTLFPVTLELSSGDSSILAELLPDLKQMGFAIEPFGKNSFVLQGTPADIETGNEKHAIDLVLEAFKHFSSELKISSREKLTRTLARQQAIKPGTRLTEREMKQLITDLFSGAEANSTPSGTPTYFEMSSTQLEKIFGRASS